MIPREVFEPKGATFSYKSVRFQQQAFTKWVIMTQNGEMSGKNGIFFGRRGETKFHSYISFM